MTTSAASVKPGEPVADRDFAAGFAELRRSFPAVADWADHPLTDILVQWDRRGRRAALVCGQLGLVAISLWLPLFLVLIAMSFVVHGAFFNIRTRNILKLFYTPNEELGLLPVNFQRYLAIRLAIQYFRQRRTKRAFLWIVLGVAIACAVVSGAGGSYQLPFSVRLVLRNGALIACMIMHFVILPTHNHLLFLNLGDIFKLFVSGAKPEFVTNRFMLIGVFVFFMPVYFSIYGVAVFGIASVLYHYGARIVFGSLSVDHYFNSLRTYHWEFVAAEGGRMKIVLHHRLRIR